MRSICQNLKSVKSKVITLRREIDLSPLQFTQHSRRSHSGFITFQLLYKTNILKWESDIKLVGSQRLKYGFRMFTYFIESLESQHENCL